MIRNSAEFQMIRVFLSIGLSLASSCAIPFFVGGRTNLAKPFDAVIRFSMCPDDTHELSLPFGTYSFKVASTLQVSPGEVGPQSDT